jgi:hypothetical protein
MIVNLGIKCLLVYKSFFLGNYIRVDTTTSDDKNYLNQQHKQLNSTTFRGPTPSAARKKTMHGVNRYINPFFYIIILHARIQALIR